MIARRNTSYSILEVSQQDLANEADPRQAYLYSRACVLLAAAAVSELLDGKADLRISQLRRQAEGLGPTSEDHEDSYFYTKAGGWQLIPIADLFRRSGKKAVVQNLVYGVGVPFGPAIDSGRVRTQPEIEILYKRMKHGGEDRTNWLKSLDETLVDGGFPMPVITIPLMSGQGTGGHSVTVVSHEVGKSVRYYEPDRNAIERYIVNSQPIPNIAHVYGESRLIFEQSEADFLERMTGEVLHVVA